MRVALIESQIVVGALVALALGLFALAAFLSVRRRLSRALRCAELALGRLRPLERTLVGLALALSCWVGGGKEDGGGDRHAASGGAAARSFVWPGGDGESAAGDASGRFFRIGSFALASNRAEIGAAWSPGFFATGSVVRLWGRFGSLTNGSEFLGGVTVDDAAATGAVFSVTLDGSATNAAFFRLSSPCDADGDGLPDWFETDEFRSDPNSADTDGDGICDSAAYVLGWSPSGLVPPRVEWLSPNAKGCRLMDDFSASSTNGLSGPLLCRTVDLPRRGKFTQYFLSPEIDCRSDVAAGGFTVTYFDDSGHTGTVDAVEIQDGVRLPLLADDVESVTVIISATSNELGCASSLHLVAYRPELDFSEAQQVLDTSGDVPAWIVVATELSTAVEFDFTGRPSSEPISDEEMLADPFGPMSGLSYDPVRHVLTASRPGRYQLPGGKTILFLSPSVSYGHGHHYSGDRVGYGERGGHSPVSPYPLDTECLSAAWAEGYATEFGCSCEPEVLSGLEPYGDDDLVETEIVSRNGDAATGVVRIGRYEVWRGEATHERGKTEGRTSDVLSGNSCGCCDAGCRDGNCDALEGPSLGSVRFRIPLGSPEASHVSGFLYFDREEPFTVRAEDLLLLRRSDACVEDSGVVDGVRAVVCWDNRGRWVAVSNATGGVEIEIRDADGTLEHVWEIATAEGAMRFRQISRLGNVMRDVSYLQTMGVYMWKLFKYGQLPSKGTRYWYEFGKKNFKHYYTKLDPCTCIERKGERN